MRDEVNWDEVHKVHQEDPHQNSQRQWANQGVRSRAKDLRNISLNELYRHFAEIL